MRLVRKPGVLALLLLAVTAGAQTRVGDPGFLEMFSAAPVALEVGIECRLFEIYLALSSEQKSRGLMFVREMREDQGMLFAYPPGSRMSIWMKNTVIPLDVVFLDEAGVIINIARNAKPYSLTSMRSARPGAFVVELNAGAADALGLEDGQTLFRADFLSF